MEPLATPTEHLVAVQDGHVVWLTMNRPDKHNALSGEMMAALPQLAAQWDADPSIRVVVMRGAGGRAFVSGADIGQLGGSIDGGRSTGNRPSMFPIDKPVIALIEGYCIGGGLALALEADLRIATPDAVFSVPAGRLGIAYPNDAIERLVGIIGATHTSRLVMTAERIDAAKALAINLLSEVVERSDIEARVTALAATIASNAPLSLRAGKLSVLAAVRGGRSVELEAAEAAARTCWTSADFVEGRAAFAAKRPPNWTGQ